MTTNREIDDRIQLEVFGLIPLRRRNGPTNSIPAYTTDDSAAFAALDRLCKTFTESSWETRITEGCGEECGLDHSICCTIESWERLGKIEIQEWAPTRPLAICSAILAYLNHRKEQA